MLLTTEPSRSRSQYQSSLTQQSPPLISFNEKRTGHGQSNFTIIYIAVQSASPFDRRKPNSSSLQNHQTRHTTPFLSLLPSAYPHSLSYGPSYLAFPLGNFVSMSNWNEEQKFGGWIDIDVDRAVMYRGEVVMTNVVRLSRDEFDK